jgi:hypothetical protein
LPEGLVEPEWPETPDEPEPLWSERPLAEPPVPELAAPEPLLDGPPELEADWPDDPGPPEEPDSPDTPDEPRSEEPELPDAEPGAGPGYTGPGNGPGVGPG